MITIPAKRVDDVFVPTQQIPEHMWEEHSFYIVAHKNNWWKSFAAWDTGDKKISEDIQVSAQKLQAIREKHLKTSEPLRDIAEIDEIIYGV